jgi:hypothetical protein
MGTADIIAAVQSGKPTTVTKKVGKGKKAVEIKVTRSEVAPVVKVVDETVKEEQSNWNPLPVDAGKRTVEVLPGLKLVSYSKGYTCLRMKGKAWGGKKVDIGRPLYREEMIHLANALLAEAEGSLSFDEAHGKAEVVPF